MQRRYETISGTAITIDDYGGEGPPIVLVHGLGGSAGNWSLVAPRLTFGRVIALDLPGHGLSGPARRHDLATHAGTVIGLIERQETGPVTLVGNSMGGLVAKMVAATRSDLVAAILLLAPATAPPARVVPSNPAVAARLAIQSLPWIGTLATSHYTSRLSPRQQVDETLRIVMHDPTTLPAEAYERAVAFARLRRTMPWASRAVAESLASIRRFLLKRSEYLAMLEAIEAPATLIFGSEDQVVGATALRWLAEHRPAWRSFEVPETGHTPMLERPDLVVREVDRLMSRTGTL
jgi:pimeloyl-ACP methyl ester carboxylesterase